MAYIAVDTTNPPGNESRGVDFLARILEAEGVPYETVESAPGRGSIWARLEGGGEPALVLLHHIDVVPASTEAWTTDPLTPVVQDGYLYGRGTVDTKGLGIIQLEAFLALHRSGKPLARDVIYMATADEEAGGILGAGWLLEHRPELFENVGFLLNEGGGGLEQGGHVRFLVEVAQKTPVWLRLVAEDTPGHGSSPRATSAPGRLIAALHRIGEAPFEPRIVPEVRPMFAGLVPDIDRAVRDPRFLAQLQRDSPMLHALTRNTCSLTVLSGSTKINVVPHEARAELDCRVLPGQDLDDFVEAIEARVADDAIRVETLLAFSSVPSPSDTELFDVIERVTKRHHPAADVVPSVVAGFTDSRFFRPIGITSYGFLPVVNSTDDVGRIHGNDERIGVERFRDGVRMMTEIVAAFAAE